MKNLKKVSFAIGLLLAVGSIVHFFYDKTVAQYQRQVDWSYSYNYDSNGNPKFPQEDFSDVKEAQNSLFEAYDFMFDDTPSASQQHSMRTQSLMVSDVLNYSQDQSKNNKKEFQTLDQEFMLYCDKFNKTYSTPKEYKTRKNNFKKNMDGIKQLYDKNSPTYEDLGSLKLGFNEYSDLSEKEWKMMNGLRIRKPELPENSKNLVDLTKKVQKSYIRVPDGSSEHSINLKNQLDKAPWVEIKVDANNAVFKNYKGGIIETHHCGQVADHPVRAIKYDKDPVTKVEYVVIENSWKNWGDNGMAKISLDTKAAGPKGVCGIYSQ